MRWTPELCASFDAAVDALGGLECAHPQQILQHMRTAVPRGGAPPDVTLSHLKSHLQKRRLMELSKRPVAAPQQPLPAAAPRPRSRPTAASRAAGADSMQHLLSASLLAAGAAPAATEL